MIGFKLDQAKGLFFDRPAVKALVDKKTRKAFSKYGAFVRRKAKGLLKTKGIRSSAKAANRKRRKPKSEGPSSPGEPPHQLLGFLREKVLFAFDPSTKNVVIGPIKLSKPGHAPEVLEYGGDETVMIDGKPHSAHYAPRPYMHPAQEIVNKQLPEIWSAS